ncbi:hypothetical protein CHUAL_013765 [Chamberlinius hualienensis]
MPPLRKPNICWKRPFTYIYGDNYAYGFNSYRDMMEWLDSPKKEGYASEPPPSQMPTLEERAAQHMRYKLGRSQTLLNAMAKKMDDEDPMSRRLKQLKKASGIDDVKDRRSRRPVSFAEPGDSISTGLRRSRSYGALNAKAAKEIDDDLEAEIMNLKNESRRRAEGVKEKLRRLQEETDEYDGISFGASGGHAGSSSLSAQQQIDDLDSAFDSILDLKANVSRKLETLNSDNCTKHQLEIENIKGRLVEAETKLRTELLQIKKRYQLQIIDLEKSLDESNKGNAELQRMVKRQALQIAELQSYNDDLQRQLQVALEEHVAAQRQISRFPGKSVGIDHDFVRKTTREADNEDRSEGTESTASFLRRHRSLLSSPQSTSGSGRKEPSKYSWLKNADLRNTRSPLFK